MPKTETRPEGHIIPARPEDLDERYTDDAGVPRRDAGRPDRPARPPRVVGPTHDAGGGNRPTADRDSYAHDAAGIRRIVRRGDPIPPGFTLEEDGEGPPVAESPAEPDKTGLASASEGYAASKKDDLQDEVDRRNADRVDDDRIDVEGTGSDGRVTKDDLVAALEADDEAQAPRDDE